VRNIADIRGKNESEIFRDLNSGRYTLTDGRFNGEKILILTFKIIEKGKFQNLKVFKPAERKTLFFLKII
jgi:hypothetical protein